MRSKHVMIVEDDVGMAELFRAGLDEQGFRCTVVHSVRDCLIRLSESTPDLLLLDYALPEMQATALVDSLAQSGTLPPFLVITGRGDERVAVQLMKLGARDYLVKDALLLDRLPVVVARIFQDLEKEQRLTRTEQSLRESEQMYRALVENLPDIVMRFDRDGRHLFVSENITQVLDLRPEQFIGKTHRELGFDEENCRWWEEMIERVFADGRSQEAEFSMKGRQGPTIFNWRLVPEMDAQGKPRSVLSISRDVTAQRRAEDALRERNRYIETVLERAPIGFAVNEIDRGECLFVSRRFEEIYGVSHATVRTVDEFFDAVYVDPVFREQIRARVMADMASGDPARMKWEDIPITTAAGEKKFVTATNIPVPDQSLMVSTVQDVTERKRAEQALRESEERYRGLIDNSLVGIGISQGDKIVFANQSLLQMYGYDNFEEFASTSLLDHLTPPSRAKVTEWRDRKARGENVPLVLEHDIVRKDGAIRTLYLGLSYVTIQGRECTQTAFVDITERRRAEEALAASERRFRETLERVQLVGVEVDAQGRIVFANDFLLQLTGWSRAEAIAQDWFETFLPPSERQKLRAAHAENIRGGTQYLQHENPILTRAGELREIRWTNTARRDQSGTTIGMVCLGQDITALKQAQLALRESEEKFRAVFEQAPDAIVVIDAQTGRLVEFNRHAHETLGYTQEEFGRLTVADVEATESPEQVLAHTEEILGARQESFMAQHRTKDGRILDIQVNSRALALHDRPLLVSIWTDVTDRRRAERQVQRTTKLLRAIKDAQELYITGADPEQVYRTLLQTLVTITDSEYGFLEEVLRDETGDMRRRTLAISDAWWSEEARALHRHHVQDAAGFHGSGSLAGLAASTGQTVISNATAQDPRYGGHVPGHPPIRTFMGLPMYFGGQVVGVAGVANRAGFYDEQIAEFLDPLVATCAGIIHAVHNHGKEQQYKEALREREQTARALLNTPGVYALLLDPAGVVLDLNRALADFLAKPEQDLIGRTIWEHFPPAVADSRRAVLADVLRSKEIIRHEEQNEDRWSDTVVYPILGPAGEIERVAVLARDITEQKQAQKQAEQRQTELLHVSRLSTLGEMASGLAHELNQPLSAMMSYASASLRSIQAGQVAAEKLARNLEHIVTQCARAGEIIRRVRALAQRQQPSLTMLDINEVVREVLGLLRSDLRYEQIDVVLDLSQNLPPVMGDAIQLQQVLLNLTRNAMEALRDVDSSRRRLTLLTGIESPEMVKVTVSDTGAGIPPTMISGVFEPFFTTKEGGLGIGLSISRTIIESHRGRVWVIPGEECGCTFAFTLPAAPESRQRTSAETETG